MFSTICILQLHSHTPPCFEGVGPLAEDGVPDPHQHWDGSIIQQQGLCIAFTVASLGDLEGSEPMYR